MVTHSGKEQQITPGVGWYWFAALLFLVTAIIAPVLILLPLFRGHVTATFVIPGTNQVRLAANEYVLWDDYRTIFQGTTYSSSSNLPGGITIKMFKVADGSEVLMSSSANIWVRSNQSERKAIGKFLVPTAGDYSIRVTGQTAPRVLSLREPQLGEIFKTIVMIIPVALIGWIASPIILIVVAVRRSKSRRALKS